MLLQMLTTAGVGKAVDADFSRFLMTAYILKCYSCQMKKTLIVTVLISAFLLTGCGKESDGDGLACSWVEIDGVMKEICISDPNS